MLELIHLGRCPVVVVRVCNTVAEVVWYDVPALVVRVPSTVVITVTVIGTMFWIDLYGVM